MQTDDPLIRLLQSADAAMKSPEASGNLLGRVWQRRAQRQRKAKRIRSAMAVGAAVMLVGVSIYALKPPAPPGDKAAIDRPLAQNPAHPEGTRPGAGGLPNAEIARLRADADALAAEAEALEHQVELVHDYQVRQQLRDEHQSQLAAQLERQASLDSVDQAALVGISQGDFYRDVRQSTDEARAAYESVIDHFPDSQWAVIAGTRIGQLQMN